MLSIYSDYDIETFEDFLHFDLDVIIMDVYLGSIWGFGPPFALGGAGEKGGQHFLSQDDEGCHRSESVKSRLVAARVVKARNQSLGPKLLQVVGGVAGLVVDTGAAHDFPYLLGRLCGSESSRVRGDCDNGFHYGTDSGTVDIYAADATGTDLRRKRPSFHGTQISELPPSRAGRHLGVTEVIEHC